MFGVKQRTDAEDHLYLRFGAAYEQKLFKSSTLSERLTLLPQSDDLGEYRAVSDLAVDTPLSDRLSLRLSLLTQYDSDAGADTDQFTNTFISALRYSF